MAARISWERSRLSHHLTRMSELDPGLLHPLRTALGQIHEQLPIHGTLPTPVRRNTAWPDRRTATDLRRTPKD